MSLNNELKAMDCFTSSNDLCERIYSTSNLFRSFDRFPLINETPIKFKYYRDIDSDNVIILEDTDFEGFKKSVEDYYATENIPVEVKAFPKSQMLILSVKKSSKESVCENLYESDKQETVMDVVVKNAVNYALKMYDKDSTSPNKYVRVDIQDTGYFISLIDESLDLDVLYDYLEDGIQRQKSSINLKMALLRTGIKLTPFYSLVTKSEGIREMISKTIASSHLKDLIQDVDIDFIKDNEVEIIIIFNLNTDETKVYNLIHPALQSLPYVKNIKRVKNDELDSELTPSFIELKVELS